MALAQLPYQEGRGLRRVNSTPRSFLFMDHFYGRLFSSLARAGRLYCEVSPSSLILGGYTGWLIRQ